MSMSATKNSNSGIGGGGTPTRTPPPSPFTAKNLQEAMTRRKTLSQARQGSVVASSEQQGSAGGGGDDEQSVGFNRTLTAVDLVLYGVGSSIGAGIYVLVGLGAQIAGPAISASFVICGSACILTSLAYAEFASRIPVAGSAFTYVYVAFGEFSAWLIGWNLILGYGFTTSVVARAWADYTGDFFVKLARSRFGASTARSNLIWFLELMTEWYPFGAEDEDLQQHDNDNSGYSFSLLSILIVVVNTWILLRGVKDSATFNNVMTVLNVSVLGLVVLSGLLTESVSVDNLTPFSPHSTSGVLQGAGLVFFAFIGFDMVASLSEEVVNPEVNMPIGIVGSLVVSTFIYFAVSFVVVGMAPLQFLVKSDVPIVNALLINACCTHEEQVADTSSRCLSCNEYIKPVLAVASQVVAIGAMLGLMASSFASFMGQPRIFYRMAQDGLWFQRFGELCPETQVPRAGIIITGIGTAFLACFVPLDALANLISLGTLMVFTFVDAGVILLRVRAITAAAPRNSSLRAKRKRWNKWMVYLLILYTGSLVGASMILANSHSTSYGTNNSSRWWWHSAMMLALVATAVATAIIVTFLPDTWSQPEQPGCNEPRAFLCPLLPGVPLAGVACNAFMMGSMPLSSWFLIVIWLSLGIVVYFAYGIHNSELGKLLSEGELAPLLAPNLVSSTRQHYHTRSSSYDSMGQFRQQDSMVDDS